MFYQNSQANLVNIGNSL